MTRDRGGDLTEPVVSPDVYDEDYYRSSCMGSEAWDASEGAEVDAAYPGYLMLSGFEEGEALLDIGCGRGELIALAARRGASVATGVEYSPDAARLARQTIEQAGSAARVIESDARRMPVEDESFDLATMLDVVEHLSPSELQAALAEALRALRPGGRLFVHTAPNRLVYDVTYRLQRLAWPPRLRSWPSDPRNEHEHRMHVNEQSRRSLRRALSKAGFDEVDVWLGEWVYTKFLPDPKAGRLYRRLARVPGLRDLGRFDLFAVARRA